MFYEVIIDEQMFYEVIIDEQMFYEVNIDANSDGIINSVAGPCTDREGERSYLTVGQGVFMPFDNDFTGSFCIGFLMDTSSANTAPLAYFHDSSGGILGNLTVLNDSIALNIKGAEVVFTVEEVGFKRFQLCREGNETTLYDGCSAVEPSKPFPEFDPGFDNTELCWTSQRPNCFTTHFQGNVNVCCLLFSCIHLSTLYVYDIYTFSLFRTASHNSTSSVILDQTLHKSIWPKFSVTQVHKTVPNQLFH